MTRQSLPLQEAPASLFILRFSALGDVCHMVPVVRSIRAQWPETEITWCLGSLEHRLLGDLEGIRFVRFDKTRGWRSLVDLRRQLASERFDVLMHAQFSMRSNIASRMVRAPVRLGYDPQRSKDLHGLFVNQRIPTGDRQHVQDSYFSFAQTLGVAHREMRWDIPIPEASWSYADRSLPKDGPVVVINPCSRHKYRNWRPRRFARVADHAIEQLGFRVVLCGGRSETELRAGEEIERAMRHPVRNLIGKDTIKDMLATLSRVQLLITPDSGPMHMATTVGTPVIGLHAASNPQRSGPYLSRQWCVDRYDAAARQYLGKSAAEIPWGTKIERPGVMDLVEVDDVIERLDAFAAETL